MRAVGLGWAVGRARKSSFAPFAAHGSEGKPDSSRGGIIGCGGAGSSAGAMTSTGVSTGVSAMLREVVRVHAVVVLDSPPPSLFYPLSYSSLSLSLIFITRVAPHCVNTLMILHAAHTLMMSAG